MFKLPRKWNKQRLTDAFKSSDTRRLFYKYAHLRLFAQRGGLIPMPE